MSILNNLRFSDQSAIDCYGLIFVLIVLINISIHGDRKSPSDDAENLGDNLSLSSLIGFIY